MNEHIAFIHPKEENKDSLQQLFHKALDLVLNSTTTACEKRPMPELHNLFAPIEIPDAPVPITEIFENLKALIDTAMRPEHPGYIGHMDPPPATFSIIGDMVASFLNNNMFSFEMSPSFTVLEHKLLNLFAKLFGLPHGAGGVMLSGGTLSNLEAICLARNVKLFTHQISLADLKSTPVLFASSEAHTSIHKAAMVLGLGANAVIEVPTDSFGRMDTKALQQKITACKNEGKTPFCVVGTAGTTVTGMIDPLEKIHKIAQDEGLWMHVDAVFGGALVTSPQYRHLLKGVEHADSISFNPQKWLCVTKTCSMLLIRDSALLKSCFHTKLPYMTSHEEGPNIGEIALQGTRYPDILKLWLTLQCFGLQGWSKLIDNGMRLKEQFLKEVKKRPYLTLAATSDVNVICFKLDKDNEQNKALQKFLLDDKQIFLSLPKRGEELWLKAVLINPNIPPDLIDKLFNAIDEFVRVKVS